MSKWLQRLREVQESSGMEGDTQEIATPCASSVISNTSIITDTPSDDTPEAQAVLSAADPEVVWRLAALRPQIPEHGPISGRLIARPDSPTIDMIRHCATCGNPLAEGRRYRCAPCQHAVWLACNAPAPAQQVAETRARNTTSSGDGSAA